MKSYEFANAQHLRVISRCARVQPLDDRRYITEDAGVHQSWRSGKINEGESEKKIK